VRTLRMEWRVVYYPELAAFASRLQAGGFVHVPMYAAR